MTHTNKPVPFFVDRRGNVLIMFALAIIPILGLAGLALDYGNARVNAARMQSCVDAAVLAGARAAREVLTTPTGTKSGAEAAAKASADRYVRISCAPPGTVTTAAITSAFKVTYGNLMADISFKGSSKSYLGSLFGISSIPIAAVAQSQVLLPTFLNTYFLIDNSQSMGFASLPSGRDQLKKLTTNYASSPNDVNCTFACHLVEKYNKSFYDLARENGIELRIDTFRYATIDIVRQAEVKQVYPGQFKFDVTVFDRTVNNVLPLSADFLNVRNTLDSKVQLSTVDNMGATYPEAALAALAARLPTSGDGMTASTAEVLVVFATDGVADMTLPNSFSQRNVDRPNKTPALLPGACDEIVRKGAKIAVIETTFTKVPGNPSYDNHVAPWYDQISPALARCATSPKLYFKADYSWEIRDAFNSVFAIQLPALRLTK